MTVYELRNLLRGMPANWDVALSIGMESSNVKAVDTERIRVNKPVEELGRSVIRYGHAPDEAVEYRDIVVISGR